MADQVTVQIGANTSGLNRGLTQGQQSIQNFGRAAERASQGVRSSLYGLMNLSPVTMAIGGSLLAVGSIMAGMHKMLGSMDQIGKQAKSVELSTDAFQTLSIASAFAGVKMEKLLNIITKLNGAVSQGATGTSKYVEAFHNLGLSVKELENMSPDKRLYAVLDAVKEAGKSSTTDSALIDIFGTKNMQDINKLNAADFTKLAAAASLSNSKISEEQIKMAEAYTDSTSVLMNHIKAVVADSEALEAYSKTVIKMAENFEKANGKWYKHTDEDMAWDNKSAKKADYMFEHMLDDPQIRAALTEAYREVFPRGGLAATPTGAQMAGVAAASVERTGDYEVTDQMLQDALKRNNLGNLTGNGEKILTWAAEKLGYSTLVSMEKRPPKPKSPGQIAQENAEFTVDRVLEKNKKIANDVEYVKQLIAYSEKLYGVKLKEEEVEKRIRDAEVARKTAMADYIVNSGRAIEETRRAAQYAVLEAKGDKQGAAALKKAYELQDMGLGGAAEAYDRDYEWANASLDKLEKLKRRKVRKTSIASNFGINADQIDEFEAGLRQHIAEMEAEGIRSVAASLKEVSDSIKKIQETTIGSLSSVARQRYIDEKMQSMSNAYSGVDSGTLSKIKELEGKRWDIEHWFKPMVKEFSYTTNELTQRGGFQSGGTVERNRTQDQMLANLVSLKTFTAQIEKTTNELQRQNEQLVDALI